MASKLFSKTGNYTALLWLRTEYLCIRHGGGFLLDNKVFQDCLVSGEYLRIRKLKYALAHERCGSAVSGGCSFNSRVRLTLHCAAQLN